MKQWLALVRLPNLFTVPGDILAGFFLAAAGAGAQPGFFEENALRVFLAVAASASIYAGGVALNDFADRNIDAAERPERPIPSGAVSPRAALALSAALFAGGLACAWFAGALPAFSALAFLAAFYDWRGFRGRFPRLAVGAISLCRGLNVLAGASVAIPLPACVCIDCIWPLRFALAGALAMAAYVGAFSAVARTEAESDEPSPSRLFYGPAAAIALFLAPAVFATLASIPSPSGSNPVESYFAPFALAIAFLQSLVLARWHSKLLPVPQVAGRFVENIVRVQAALVLCLWNSVPALMSGAIVFFAAAAMRKTEHAFPPS